MSEEGVRKLIADVIVQANNFAKSKARKANYVITGMFNEPDIEPTMDEEIDYMRDLYQDNVEQLPSLAEYALNSLIGLLMDKIKITHC